MAHNIHSDFEERTSQLSKSLEELRFPADKFTIIHFAHSNELDSYTQAIVTKLPERLFQDLRDVLAHFIGGAHSTDV